MKASAILSQLSAIDCVVEAYSKYKCRPEQVGWLRLGPKPGQGVYVFEPDEQQWEHRIKDTLLPFYQKLNRERLPTPRVETTEVMEKLRVVRV